MFETTIPQLLATVHQLLIEGQQEVAFDMLDKIRTDNLRQKREIAYLRAWGYMLQNRWDEAAQFLLDPEHLPGNADNLHTFGQTVRRRRSVYLVLLGNVAVNLGRYEEATRHYAQAIRFLDERRMNNRSLRIKATVGLGTAYMQTGFLSTAEDYYEDALDLCDNEGDPAMSDICCGLCEVHCRLGHFDEAMQYGKKALDLYVNLGDKQMEERMERLLGKVCQQRDDYPTAAFYFTQALMLAESAGWFDRIIINLTSLAEVRLAEGSLNEAKHYCEQALGYGKLVPNTHSVGMSLFIYGKVVEAQAQKTEQEEDKQVLLKRAINFYNAATAALLPLQAADLPEVYRTLARLLEAVGRTDAALSCWKTAYEFARQTQSA